MESKFTNCLSHPINLLSSVATDYLPPINQTRRFRFLVDKWSCLASRHVLTMLLTQSQLDNRQTSQQNVKISCVDQALDPGVNKYRPFPAPIPSICNLAATKPIHNPRPRSIKRRNPSHDSSLPLLITQILQSRNKKCLIDLQLRNLNPESLPTQFHWELVSKEHCYQSARSSSSYRVPIRLTKWNCVNFEPLKIKDLNLFLLSPCHRKTNFIGLSPGFQQPY